MTTATLSVRSYKRRRPAKDEAIEAAYKRTHEKLREEVADLKWMREIARIVREDVKEAEKCA